MSEHPIDRLFRIIAARKAAGDAEKSYTAQLLRRGTAHCAQKFGEESIETVIAAMTDDKAQLAAESADALYHLLVLWAAKGLAPEDVYAVLRAREAQSGLEEKAKRSK